MKNSFKRLLAIGMLVLVAASTYSQDIFTRGLVYQVAGMKNAIVKEKIAYHTVHDTTLTYDLYYPPGFDFKKNLPLVIFNNGAGGMDVPRWGIYKDWAKLVAASGMIAVNYQSLRNNSQEDGEALLDHLAAHAAGMNIDAGKIGLWTSSANARVGMRLAYKTRPTLIKALVEYYGGPDSLGQLRQDLPTFIVRCGLDAQFMNTGIDNFIQSALQQDAQIEVVNYIRGIHAFDAFQHTDESNEIIIRTMEFLKKNLWHPQTDHDFILTNKNFIWLVLNNQLPKAVTEFRKAREMYRADPGFQPFFNGVIREDALNANAYWLLDHQRQADALELFKLAVESYPESPNAYESLSEAYEILNKKAEAIHNAEICLQKLPAATGMEESFKQRVKQGAEERIRRLK